MSEATAIHGAADLRPAKDAATLRDLSALALDLRWSWNHAADEVWRRLDPALWDLTHNPRGVLQAVGAERIAQECSDPAFRRAVSDLLQEREKAANTPAWFQLTYPGTPLDAVAYFSMEFMLSEALPIYSGGLGNVAGDQLKAASDLRVPVIGVGLLYQVGYFRQIIGPQGEQISAFPYNDPGQLPIEPLRDPSGEWLRLPLNLPGHRIWLRAWQVRVGNAKLYLLDSNDIANYAPYRAITAQLYVGDPKLRLLQEFVLGVAGWRLLEATGEAPTVCHLNEGHAALAVLERARCFMQASGEAFDVALAVTRAGNVFTTHTAVAAGFDRFAPELVVSLLRDYAEAELGIGTQDLLALGRRRPDDPGEPFNMAYLAIRGSGAINGVSRLHGRVSRHLFAPLFERWPVDDVPVGYVTNGVHMPSWDSAEADELWTEVSGKERWRGAVETLEHEIRQAPDARLWQFRNAARAALVDHIRERRGRDLALSGAPADAIARARELFDPNVLTVGFARRFATYKRPNLLLHDAARLVRLLSDAERPIQLVLAGKAHPADRPGRSLIHEWFQFIRGLSGLASRHVVFLADYDMLLTERLVQGVDVWLNTPRRPWEASGTSGMKALVNGALNLSELDGWWAEAYTPECGWALGSGESGGDDARTDSADALVLFELLEREIVPEFYTRDSNGIPTAWVARMRESMARLTPRFSTNRSVREYLEKYYLPAATAFRRRAAQRCAVGKRIANWQRALERRWGALHFGNVEFHTENGLHTFDVELFYGDIEPGAVRVELFAEGGERVAREIREMTYMQPTTAGGRLFRASVAAARPAADYTPRVVPWHEDVSVPLEARQILWQR